MSVTKDAPPVVRPRAPEPPRRLGVDAEHDNYKWWALSCTSLGMLLATINSGTLIIALPDLERSLHTSLLELVWVILVYMIASTVLVLSAGRLSDQFGRKQAYIGGFVDLRRGLARGRIRRQRHPADPVADPAGDRRRVPVRQRRRDRHRLLPQGAARAGDGHEHDGRRRRAGDRPGARRRAGRDLLALGVLVQRAVRPGRLRLGRGGAARDLRRLGGPALRLRRDGHVPGRPHRPGARHLQGRDLGLELAGGDRRPDRRGGAAAGVRGDRAPSPRADARPVDLQQPPVLRRRGRGRSSTAWRGSP